jgi:hypothetical protein
MNTLTISTPGLNPSNRNAGFPNLARGFKITDKNVIDEITAITDAELTAAGINIYQNRFPPDGEVPSETFGYLSGWTFRRLWYYWSAKGPGIPPDIAERLHATHGTVVRVEGHCGCPSPLEWRKGFAISSYHVDSPDGLKALADTLRSIYDPDKDPDAKPYMGGHSDPR